MGKANQRHIHGLLGGAVRSRFFFQAEDGIRDGRVTGVQTCALPICSSPKSFQPSQYEDSSTDSLYALKPTGIASSIAKRKSFNLPSRIPLLNGVFTAIMPQPMSTPTVAGITASFVAMTEPTMLPLPRCASGISATCLNKHGKRETLRSIDCSSMLNSWLAHDRISCLAPPIVSF